MANLKAARRYSTALLEIAGSLNKVDDVKNDFQDIQKTLKHSRELKLFIESPLINTEKKLSIIKEIFGNQVCDITLRFLMLLCDKNRINILKDISESMLKMINQKRGIIEAKITTAIDIDEQDRKSIIEKLKKYTGKEVQPQFSVDNSIKGGFVAQIDDKIIDASILRQLEILKEKFIMGSFNN